MKYWKPIIILLSTVLLYANTINNGFVLDDFSAIVENRFVQSGTEGIPDIFTSHYRKGYWSAPGDLYRPLILASFAIEHQLADNGPKIHHLLNVVYYVILSLLLFGVLSQWFKKEHSLLPLIITLLFVFHPIHTEVVANIKSRDELWSLMFGLGALWAYAKYTRSKNFSWLLATVISFFMALLSKESSVVFMVLIPLSGFFFYEEKRNDLLKVVGLLSIPLIAFLVMRNNALANQMELAPMNLTIFANHPIQDLLTAGYHLVLYLYKLLVPISLSSQYAEFYNGPTTWVLWIGGFGLVVHLALLFYGVKWTLKRRIEGFGIMFYLISTALHSNILLIIGTQFGERLLFTPSVAFVLLLGVLIIRFLGDKPPKVLLGLVGVVLLGYSVIVLKRNSEWKSNFALYEADVEKQPESALLNYWYSLELSNSSYLKTLNEQKKKRSLNLALDYLLVANELKSNYGDAQSQTGLVYYKLGKKQEALPYYEKSIANGKGSVGTLNNMAAIHFGNKDFEKAKEYYERAVAVDPFYKDAWGNLGITYAQLNDFENAKRVFLKAIELSPKNGQLYFYMGMTLNQVGSSTEASKYFEQAFVLDPSLRK
jgi:hypothetical protein